MNKFLAETAMGVLAAVAIAADAQTDNCKREKDFAQTHHLFDGHTGQLRVGQALAE